MATKVMSRYDLSQRSVLVKKPNKFKEGVSKNVLSLITNRSIDEMENIADSGCKPSDYWRLLEAKIVLLWMNL